MPNLNDNKFKKIQSESQKQGKSQEEYAAELDANRAKAKRKSKNKKDYNRQRLVCNPFIIPFCYRLRSVINV